MYKCSAVAEVGDRLVTIDMGRKLGGCSPLKRGGGSPSNTMWPGPRPTSLPSGILIHPAVWRLQTIARNWGACPFKAGAAASRSNTMWPGPADATSLPNGILIHPAVSPQQAWAENCGGLCPLGRGGYILGEQFGEGRGLPPRQVSS